MTARAAWAADARRFITLTESYPALPVPQISAGLAAFHYTGITDPDVAREAAEAAEAILGRELGVTFTDKDVPRIGSMCNWVREAFLPSGMRVSIVAKAETRPRVPVLALAGSDAA